MNSICANQFISRKLMGFFAIRHSGSDKFDIDDALISLSKGANNLINLAPKYQSLVDQDLSLDHIINTQRNEPDQGKLFGLYQALTFITSHQMSGFNALSYGNEISEHFLK